MIFLLGSVFLRYSGDCLIPWTEQNLISEKSKGGKSDGKSGGDLGEEKEKQRPVRKGSG
jgi:hypothetical protein